MIKANGRVTRKEVQDALKISGSTAGRLLDAMQEKGLIKQVGQYKDTHYVLELVLSE
ncbi:winged helix-turn-helix domain-containing protein [bacterium]|nr:winged helix-turn-helix domain-containing protein [bacterium]